MEHRVHPAGLAALAGHQGPPLFESRAESQEAASPESELVAVARRPSTSDVMLSLQSMLATPKSGWKRLVGAAKAARHAPRRSTSNAGATHINTGVTYLSSYLYCVDTPARSGSVPD